VITPLYKGKRGQTRKVRREDGTSEERPVRFDADAAFHTEGGGDRVWGTKYALVSTRRPNGRFILAIVDVEKGMDEASAAIEMLRCIKPHAPGAQAVVWDMILRGVHINVILTELGLVAVVGVHAKARSDRTKSRKDDAYIPKTVDLDDIEVTLPDGTTEIVHLAAHGGWLSVKEINEIGELYYEHLVCTRIQRHEDRKGFRFYGYFRLPDTFGSKEIPVRLFQNKEDDARGINRPENLRAIPEGSEDFARLSPLRPDAESINNEIERSLYINRASGKGWRRQMVDLFAHARLINAITLARCRPRERIEAA